MLLHQSFLLITLIRDSALRNFDREIDVVMQNLSTNALVLISGLSWKAKKNSLDDYSVLTTMSVSFFNRMFLRLYLLHIRSISIEICSRWLMVHHQHWLYRKAKGLLLEHRNNDFHDLNFTFFPLQTWCLRTLPSSEYRNSIEGNCSRKKDLNETNVCTFSSEKSAEGYKTTKLEQILLNGNNICMVSLVVGLKWEKFDGY